MKRLCSASIGMLALLLMASSGYGSDYPKTRYQGWSPQEREQLYYTSGGSMLLPCSWFLALEQKDNTSLFIEDHNITQLHLVPNLLKETTGKNTPHQSMCKELDKANKLNTSWLPVGLAITEVKEKQYKKIENTWVGFTCAFCHTGELQLNLKNGEKHTLYIDGGASMQWNAQFLDQLVRALSATLEDADKFSRFAEHVNKIRSPHAKPIKTDEELVKFAKFQMVLRAQLEKLIQELKSRYQIDIAEWGFGRFDALGRGSNLVFSHLSQDNLRHSNAPVSIPSLWYTWQYDAVQWSGLIRHPIARNIAQTIAVGAGLFEFQPEELASILNDLTPSKVNLLFRSNTNIRNIIKLEHLVRKLQPPDWPADLLGVIDPKLATAGKELYNENCKGCHDPQENQYPAPAQCERGQTFKAKIIPRLPEETNNEIGTDPTYLNNVISRYVLTGSVRPGFNSQESLLMAKAVERVTSKILCQAQHERTLTPPFGAIDDNSWEHPKDENGKPMHGYVARPLAGIWATPPYLHNGSVPTLYDLLSPSKLPADVPQSTTDEGNNHVRPGCFRFGTMEFDPKKVGYSWTTCEFQNRPDSLHSGFNFWTTRPGNSNTGHEYTTYKDPDNGVKFSDDECKQKKLRPGVLGCTLSHDDRMAIIEYLKTSDLNKPFASEGSTRWSATAPPGRYCQKIRNEPVYKRDQRGDWLCETSLLGH